MLYKENLTVCKIFNNDMITTYYHKTAYKLNILYKNPRSILSPNVYQSFIISFFGVFCELIYHLDYICSRNLL